MNDFAGRMYGRSVQLFVVVLSLVNMTVSLIAEYTAIGDLFEHYVGGERISIIIVVGVITAMYTASGGLLVSIVTDRAQVSKQQARDAPSSFPCIYRRLPNL